MIDERNLKNAVSDLLTWLIWSLALLVYHRIEVVVSLVEQYLS